MLKNNLHSNNLPVCLFSICCCVQVEVVSDEDVSKVENVLSQGEVFADREMLTESTHTATTRARDHVELLALSLQDLRDSLRAFPEVYQGAYQYALNNYNYSIYV